MLHESVAEDLRKDELAPGFVRPAWEDYCFANIPDTVLSLFGEEADRSLPETVFENVATDIEHVVLAFVDGFGWNHFQRARDEHSFLTKLAKHATVTPLTAGYPSATAAAISTIHTGQQPVEHGILGWNTHVESLGGTVQALLFANRDRTALSEVRENTDATALIDERTIYERLDAESLLVLPKGIGGNPYDAQVNGGAQIRNYEDTVQAAYQVREHLEHAKEPTYCYCYLPNVDSISHKEGVSHDQTDAQLGSICYALEREVVEKLDPTVAERTLLLLVADHGQIDTVPKERISKRTLDVDAHLKTDGSSEPIPIQGGPRNLQFHVREGHQGLLRTKLEKELAMLDPLVFGREQIIDMGLFGDREPSKYFNQRCPDLLVIPRRGYVESDNSLSKIGMHSGLHPDEMLVPFAAARVDSLRT
ncbi:alkaline phosphatase family protein [Halococcus hamelinensis]|uniref:Type I phosphodiesterase/nucleotide pyrophosphatase n=1 Tax=Halococcus hamelinensis 100A6 TaxID=1132509 RepID=M0M9G0_9EURY|nr:alkaline phosphatase family protein [Halococcus hamelinensis]EMA41973.1 type I phosphodiesterase/nucleotide pyrophosphatase [Halococcus hamelinensis 100A6]